MDPNIAAGGADWVGFLTLVAFLLFIDLFFHRKERRIRAREALGWTIFWVALAVGFGVWVYFRFGKIKALEFAAGYLVEEALSVDNLFVFVVIFRYFKVPPEHQHRVLFWGILGAIVMRFLFVLAGIGLIRSFHYFVYIFGVFLIFTGGKLLVQKEAEVDPERNWLLRIFRRYVPTTTDYQGARFLVRRDGRIFATPLLLVLLVVESTDLVFAVDSVPAIIALTDDSYIVFTSNIFAILGLRSLYFLLAGMMEVFRYLKVGLSLVLIFVGCKMLLPRDLFPIGVALGVIAGILATSVIASVVLPGKTPPPAGDRIPPGEEG